MDCNCFIRCRPLYFDGAAGWEILLDKTAADFAGGELRFARGYLTGLSLNF